MSEPQVENVAAETFRKLATIRRIDKLEPIEGADRILKATVGGWQLVTAKDNNFKEGDLVVYCEIDSWIPTEVAEFLSKGKEPREFNGVKGERLKTIRLRGQISQGLILPFEGDGVPESLDKWKLEQLFPDTMCDHVKETGQFEGADVTEVLGIQKWEKPLPAQLAGQTRRYFPSFLRKTDEERVQNLKKEIKQWYEDGIVWEVSEKVDGSSMTAYVRNLLEDYYDQLELNIDFGVCSRNLELKMDQEGNSFVDTAKNSGLIEAMKSIGKNYAVQGELYGVGIQGNNEGITGIRFALFNVWDIDEQKYLSYYDRWAYWKELVAHGAEIDHVGIIHDNFVLQSDSIDDLLQMAEGKNAAGNEREGLVFKSKCGQFSFKAISNKFLMKNDG